MAEKILVVDDEITLQETLLYNLAKEGYDVKVTGDGFAAVDLARSWSPDIILLDIMLPGLDGFEVCKVIRKEMNIPILMLTARQDEVDRVVGLEVGADDYLTKPFSMRELIARVRAQLRRTQAIRDEIDRIHSSGTIAQQDVLSFANLAINRTRREVTLDDKVLTLKPQEYELLLFFGENKGRMLTRDHILERVWGWDYTGDSRTVDVHVRWLRQKIEADPTNPRRIVTVRGGGYRFEG